MLASDAMVQAIAYLNFVRKKMQSSLMLVFRKDMSLHIDVLKSIGRSSLDHCRSTVWLTERHSIQWIGGKDEINEKWQIADISTKPIFQGFSQFEHTPFALKMILNSVLKYAQLSNASVQK